jgi:hypothetical protein
LSETVQENVPGLLTSAVPEMKALTAETVNEMSAAAFLKRKDTKAV